MEGVIAAHGVTTLHYLAARTMTEVFARRCVSDVLTVFAVAPVDAAVLRDALSLEFSDFEDAVCAAAASATVKKLEIGARSFACQVDDAALFARIRSLPPGQSLSLQVDVADSIVHGGELRREFRVTGLG